MSNYTKTTNFATKDALASGNPAKIVKGTEIDTEFNNIAVASGTKADKASPVFTGTVTLPVTNADSLSIGGDGVTVTGIKDEDDMASNSATKLASQQSIKAYVDSQVTAQDLDVTDGTTSISIDLDSEALSLLGGTGVTSTASGNGVTMAIDATVATLSGSQTLTNKTLATPAVTGALTTNSTIDGRDVAADGTKLDGIESGATTDQTAAEIRALVEAATDSNVFTDADHTKLNGIEASADVTDTANVTAAGALMDSELTSIASVKALNQGVATTDSPTFAAATVTGEITANGGIALGDNDKATFGASDDLQIYHDGSNSYIDESATGSLLIRGSNLQLRSYGTNEYFFTGVENGASTIYYDGLNKLATTSTGIDVTGTATMDGLYVEAASGYGFMEIGGPSGAFIDLKSPMSDDYDLRLRTTGTSGELVFPTGDFVFTRGSIQKLAVTATGIDVNGTVTADGLSVDGNSNLTNTSAGASAFALVLQNQSSDTSTAVELGFDNTAAADKTSSLTKIGAERVNSPYAGDTDLYFKTQTNGGSLQRLRIATSGDISFYEDTGTTAKLFWDASAESLGIGTSSPLSPLHIQGTDDVAVRIKATGANSLSRLLLQNDARTWAIDNDGANGDALTFYDATAVAERMRIDASGNVGIGTSSPSTKLTVDAAATISATNYYGASTWTAALRGSGVNSKAGLLLNSYSAAGQPALASIHSEPVADYRAALVATYSADGSGAGYFAVNQFRPSYSDTLERMRIDSTGNVGIGTDSPATKFHVYGGNSGSEVDVATFRSASGAFNIKCSDLSAANPTWTLRTFSAEPLAFAQGTDERMRIDASGNLLVGKTVSNIATAGVELTPNDRSAFTRANGSPILANRTASDGSILDFRKDGTTVGSIGTRANLLTIGNGDTGLLFNGTNDSIIPESMSGVASRDAAIDLGHTSARFKDLYLSSKAYIGSGSLFDTGGDISLNQGSRGIRINDAASAISPTNGGASNSDATTDLGVSNIRFKDLYLSGGVYLGGTGAANKLDDYEEGTFTPVVSGTSVAGAGTYTIQSGKYVIVGKMVYVSIRLGWSAHTGSGNMVLAGLPNTANNEYANLGVVFRDGLTVSSGHTVNVGVVPNTNYANILEISTGTDYASVIALDTAVNDIAVSGWYRIA